MKQQHKEELAKVILPDLQDPAMTHLMIAAKHNVGLSFIIKTAKQYGLVRKKGRKSTHPVLTPEEKQAARLEKGRCAVHGLGLEMGRPIGDGKGSSMTTCPRRDCELLYRTDRDGLNASLITQDVWNTYTKMRSVAIKAIGNLERELFYGS